MDSGTERPSSASNFSPSSGLVERTINVNGQELHIIQLPNFDLMEHVENLRRRASEPKCCPRVSSGGTPVDTLPNELLSYIFTLGSEAEEYGDGDTEDEEDEDEEDEEEDDDEEGVPPMFQRRPRLPFKVLVSHVCQRWRTVAIETSTLWTHLSFVEGPPFDKSRTLLERSKGCALDIELDCTAYEDADTDESADPPNASRNDELVAPEDRVAMPGGPAPVKPKSNRPFGGRLSPTDLPVVRDLIIPHAWRWRIFELMVNDYQIMYGILSTLASIPEAPQLQVLRLYHYDDNDDYDHFRPAHLRQPFCPFRGRAPNLVQAALWGVHVDWETCAFLQGLEELELAYHAQDVRPPYEIFSRILQGSPDLHILTLCASGPAGNPEDWPTDVIELPSVKHLVLAFVEPSYASALMKRLVFPNLSTLALDFDAGDYSSFLAQLARPAPTQRHSLCQNLIDLKISGMTCSEAALATFYAALPNLASLNINCYHLHRYFFEFLLPRRGDAGGSERCYLPKLETISTSGIGGAEMRQLLTSRTTVPLKHVLMDSAADVDIEEEDWLRSKVETFDFFDGSDDEDDDDPDLDEQEEMETAAFAAEGDSDGVPGEWVEEDDPMP